VVVEAALPPAARAWVSSVVSALAPTFTWAVAQASTKVADVVSWAEVIGEVDAVALENVPATGDPAASLAGPLPIGLLDGRRASVSRWMAMLTMEGGPR
jgi:TRAP-type C4-dicarboxylate transport system permease small subunit